MVPREREIMGGSPSIPNGDESTIPKGRGQDTNATTAKPMQILIIKNYKEANKRPGRGVKHNGSIKPHVKILEDCINNTLVQAKQRKDKYLYQHKH